MSEDRTSPDPRYGSWKFIHEIELGDLLEHPVWHWCMELGLEDEDDGPIGGDETSMRPLLNSDEIPFSQKGMPLILLRVKGTDYFASGLYDPKKGILEAITIQTESNSSNPRKVDGLPEPTIYVAVPVIGGRRGLEFQSISKSADEARLVI